MRASADEHPDLFWALRGGGGNFGVVCEFEFRLHEVDTVIAGPTFWPAELGAEVLKAYREFLPAAPRELYGFFAYATVPPADPFPAAIHLRDVCGIIWHHRGSQEQAARDMAPLLDALPEPLLHGVQPVPHPAMQSAFDALYPKGDQWYWRADFVQEIPDAAVDLHARFGSELPTLKSTMHLYPIDGAAHDLAPGDTAWSYRDATWATVYAGVDPDPANADADPRLDRRLPGGAAPVLGRRRLREHDDGGGPGPGARELPRQLRPAGRGEGGLRPRQRLPHQPEHRAGGEAMMRALLAVLGALAVTAPAAGAQTPQCAVLGTPCKLSVGLNDAQFMNPHPAPNGQRVVFAHRTLERPGGALHRPDPRRLPRAAQPSRART